MAGRPGQIPWNKRSIEEHLKMGTLRPERHLRRLTQADDSLPVWEPTPDDLAGLGEAGRRWLLQMHEQAESSMPQGTILLLAAHAVDSLAIYQPQAATDPRAARLCVSLSKLLASLMVQLRLS